MTQVLTVAAAYDFLDAGEGIDDVDTAAAAATDTELQWANSGNEVLYVSNGGASPITATLNGAPDPYGRSADVVRTIPAGGVGVIGFASPAMFNAPGSTANVTLSDTTSVKVLLTRQRKNR